MAEWLYEDGIGENRAVLLDGGEIIEAAIELPAACRAGAVVAARLVRVQLAGRRGVAVLDGGDEALVEPLPPGLSEGAAFRAEILREPIPEPGHAKLARVRASEAAPRPGPALADRIGDFSRHGRHGRDRFEEAGWSELLDEALRGEIAFPGGALRMSPTPAMTLFDVDGTLAPAELARAGAAAAARTIRRFGIGGSIGIDLPTLPGRAERQAAAAALDALLPQPFERTAVNGFGFLQIVRRRDRASLPETLRSDPVGAAARALLRRAERVTGPGARLIAAAPAVIARLEANPDWIDELGRRAGAAIRLQADRALTTSAGNVQNVQS